ncbi:uncharacterized protein METZ01_LOCUS333172, partial [marine metagenome]
MTQKRQLLLVLFSISYLIASGGKITGRITSMETGEPLPGVNIFVEEVSLGAATDVNGEYVILNVSPGSYTLRATYIGYATHLVQSLNVNTDMTTRQDFILKQEVIKGDIVTVVAERPLVQKDLTASQKIRTYDDIKDMPVESFLGVLATQA